MQDDGRGRHAPQRFRILVLKILVTGASGFTGHHFIASAQTAGHRVLVLNADLTNIDTLRSELGAYGPLDAVVHLAGIAFVGHSDNAAFYAVNTVGTSNLLQVLASDESSTDRPRVLVASSANVYGNCEQSPISEDQAAAPVNHYAASKLAMEHIALTYSDRLRIVLARPFNYTGPGQSSSFVVAKMVDHFVRRAPVIELGNLHVEREFNDVRMVCEAYLRLLVYGVSGRIYNICTGQPHTLQSVLNILTELTGHHPQIRVNPSLVRINEVYRLCGSTTRLLGCTGHLPTYSLKDTLLEMVGTSSAIFST